jgi:hypothetical protein
VVHIDLLEAAPGGNGVHADHGVVAEEDGVVDDAAVSQRDPGADGACLARTGVDDGVVLHGAAVSENDGPVVAAEAGARPDPAAGAQRDVADDVGGLALEALDRHVS